jgi:hypothetical protein
MRRIRIATLTVIAVFLGGAIVAASAVAAQTLIITEDRTPLADGAQTFLEFGAGLSPRDNTFHEGAYAEVAITDKARDKISVKPAREWGCDNDYFGCPAGYARSGGGVETVELTTHGKVTVKFSSKVELAEPSTPGPCIYAFAGSAFKSTFSIGVPIGFEQAVSGKLNKRASNPECAKTRTAFFGANFADDNNPAGYLESELGS